MTPVQNDLLSCPITRARVLHHGKERSHVSAVISVSSFVYSRVGIPSISPCICSTRVRINDVSSSPGRDHNVFVPDLSRKDDV